MENGHVVLNLANSSIDAWIIAIPRNSDGSARGTVDLQRGTRKELLF